MMLFNGRKDLYATDTLQQSMSIHNTIPAHGYHPVSLLSRAQSRVKGELIRKRPDIPRAMLEKRPRYKLDPLLEEKTDELFRDVIRPRMSIYDSEEMALA